MAQLHLLIGDSVSVRPKMTVSVGFKCVTRRRSEVSFHVSILYGSAMPGLTCDKILLYFFFSDPQSPSKKSKKSGLHKVKKISGKKRYMKKSKKPTLAERKVAAYEVRAAS